MTKRSIVLALLAGLAALPVSAQQADPVQPASPMRGPRPMGGGGMGMLRMADANGDGVVTRAEYQAAVDARFARFDANHDGVLSADERPMGRGRFASHDGGDTPPPPPPNGSSPEATGTPPAPPAGTPRPPETRDQYVAGAMRRFDRIDANHDGRIDQTEMAAMRPMRDDGRGAPPPTPAD